jgi:hypothetical protein
VVKRLKTQGLIKVVDEVIDEINAENNEEVIDEPKSTKSIK